MVGFSLTKRTTPILQASWLLHLVRLVGHRRMLRHRQRITARTIMVLAAILNIGCRTGQTRYTHIPPREELRSSSPPVQFEHGAPNLALDTAQTVIEVPQRVLYGGELAERTPGPQTCEVLTDYMQQNELTDVPVLVREYDPIGEWKRLYENDQIRPFWKYTAGSLSIVQYSIFPDRVFRRDVYNPFTNSLSVNSDCLTSALREAAYAKDVRSRTAPGSYATFNSVPGLSLWKSTVAVNDVLDYARASEQWPIESDVYRRQYPYIACESMTPATYFMTPVAGFAATMGGSATGYFLGRSVEAKRQSELEQKTEEPEQRKSIHFAGYVKPVESDSVSTVSPASQE